MNITVDEKNVAGIGDKIIHNGKIRKVIGYAIGEDGRPCYVTSMENMVWADGTFEWRTFLVPIESVRTKMIEVEIGGSNEP